MNLVKTAAERNFVKPQQRGTGRTHRLLEKALAAAKEAARENRRGRVVFVCRGGMEAYLRTLVKKVMKHMEGQNPIHPATLQWFQLWPLQRDLTSLQGTPHVFVLDHDVDCPEVRGAFSGLGPGRVLL